jgi:HNH endonuclease
MAISDYPSCEFLHECFVYDDGVLIWKDRPRSHFNSDSGWRQTKTKFSGKIAGCIDNRGGQGSPRIKIGLTLNGKMVLFYRYALIWIMFGNEIPEGFEVDHKDTNPANDRIENLRLAKRAQNIANTGLRRNNTSGYKGVSWYDNKWHAEAWKNGVKCFNQSFDSKEEAAVAYIEKAKEIYGEFYHEIIK